MQTIIAGIDVTNEASLHSHKSSGFEEGVTFQEQEGFLSFDCGLDLKFLQLMLR